MFSSFKSRWQILCCKEAKSLSEEATPAEDQKSKRKREPNLVAVIDGGRDLAEDPPRFGLRQHLPLAQVVVQLAARCVLHHQHHFFAIFEHCKMKRPP